MAERKNEYTYKGILKTDLYAYKVIINTSQRKINGEQVIYHRYFNIGAYTSEKGEKKTCVDIYVMYPALKAELPQINPPLAKLITTHYNEKCSVNEKLERGEGTRHMIGTAMYLVSKMCPHVMGFEINDASTRLCDNNALITLSYFSITNYGKTWYEKHFDAFIEDEKKANKYKETVAQLLSMRLPEWGTFTALFLRNTPTDIRNKLEALHKKSTTYKDLFTHIHKLGINNACIYLQPWIDNVMLSTDLRNLVLFTQWVIPIKAVKRVPLLNYTTEFSGLVVSTPSSPSSQPLSSLQNAI